MNDDVRDQCQADSNIPQAECGFCGDSKRICVTGDYKHYVYPEIIKFLLDEEGLNNDEHEAIDLFNRVKIARYPGGSGSIECPCC